MSTLTVRALLVVGALGLGLNTPIAEAHQCVQVLILDSPQRVHAGSRASMVAGVVNCGSCPTPVALDAWLYDPLRDVRVHLGSEYLRLGMDEARRVKLLLHIPSTVPPGRYMLVLSGTTSSGYMDLARARICVLPGPRRDVRRLLMRLAGDPTDLAAMEELAAAAGDLAGELGLADAIALADDITGEIVHKDKKKKKIRVKNRVGRVQTVKVTHNTVIVDANGNNITFDDLHEGDRVDVDYNSSNEATRIEVH
jgi:hypothetical protein